ncbi:hypothetical protein GCM10027413_17890 [Conyzicola nivalis]|uniref:SHOCT domain-containing protein n=1 Tax=Conyzicola nivalis TaxID=1477021 RepID=A0A916SFG0_9MICO|nr:SHOCT domain-containing protein [Conyzicola nivalis]GGA96524.1 hypothetical protein GCM10010979_08730 [Conyzicola nivalis]
MSQGNWAFGPIFAIVGLILTVVFVLVVVGAVLRVRKPRSKAERLAKLDSLLANGAISQAEHAEARAVILRE